MTIVQRFTVSSALVPLSDSDVIMIGNGVSLHYVHDVQHAVDSVQQHRVPLYESGWFMRRGNAQTPASRADILRVLSNLESVLVRASLAQNMRTTSLIRVNMDIAVSQVTGGPRVQGAEQCVCPPGTEYYSQKFKFIPNWSYCIS